jgi:hypothetical protein
MSQWDTPIEIDFPDLFSSIDRAGFPVLPDWEQGIRIYVDNLNYEDGLLYGHLLVSFAFKRQFLSGFQDIDQAINIIIENVESGQCHYMNLIDPHKKFPSMQGDNFNSINTSDGKGVMTSYCEIPFTMKLKNPGWGPSLFIRAILQKFTSNIIAIDCSEDLSLVSFLNNEEHVVNFLEDDDE